MPDVELSSVLWGLAAGFATFVVSLGLMWLAVVLIPADYFLDRRDNTNGVRGGHPVVRLALRVVKNLLGVLLVLAGLVMLVAPGQGVLSVLIGLLLLDVPGKRRLELKLLRRPGVYQTITWLRGRVGRLALQLPDEQRD